MKTAFSLALVCALTACKATSSGWHDLAFVADAAPHDLALARRPFPTLTPHSAAVLKPMQLVTVVAKNDALASELLTFSDHLVVSDWWKAAAVPFGVGPATSVHATGRQSPPT